MLRRLRGPLIAVVVALALVVTAVIVIKGKPGKKITAYFTVAVGVYTGSDVRVLGVKVGTIDTVHPEGTRVRAVISVDRKVKIPADANAVLMAPSVVSDRYIQLSPPYTTGPEMAGGAVIPVDRTATPVELDTLYDSLKTITAELGPNGANATGSLSELLRVAERNLQGNGGKIRTTVQEFSKAAKTLTGSKDDLFATIENLQKFTTMIKNNDGQVRQAERQLAAVTGFLADDRENLGAALTELADALVKVKDFIEDNRALIKTNVEKLSKITQVLVNQRKSLAEALDVMPLTVGNVLNAYDPASKTIRGRGNLNDLPLPMAGAGQ